MKALSETTPVKMRMGAMLALIGFIMVNEAVILGAWYDFRSKIDTLTQRQADFIQQQSQVNSFLAKNQNDFRAQQTRLEESQAVFSAKVKTRINLGD